ncbi:MAG: GDP-mannose 4,6-dehydratase [Nitrospiraceae bacterium]|nr:GDP-mannose 4,6-dehydratase [Nitrospiraceae bacterium]
MSKIALITGVTGQDGLYLSRHLLGRGYKVYGTLRKSFEVSYVEAMWMMLQREKPGDYVIATGETHSVREFVEVAFRAAGIEIAWSGSGTDEKGTDRETGKTVVRVAPEKRRDNHQVCGIHG